MRKLLVFLCIAMVLFSFCGCETKEKKEARKAQEYADQMNDAYEKAKQDYNDLKNSLNDYNKQYNRIVP